jgi:type I restriction enzyme M protein
MSTNYREISNTIWNIATLALHGTFHAYQYQDVILPLTVLKRLDDALEPTKQKTLERFNELDGKVTNLNILYRTTGYNFYNTSPYTFRKLLEAPTQAAPNLRKYIDGFSDNVKEIFAKFEFDAILDKLQESNLLYLALREFNKIDLHPDKVENYVIGLAFEDLIRRFAEQSNETAGEHYTPRDVVRLMTSLLFTGEEKELARPGVIKEIYDPACGTGGMLTVSKDYIRTHFNKDAKIFLYGQELNATTCAVCKADMLLKGEDIDSIKGGDKEHTKASTLSNDQHNGQRFDYVLSNPPFGVSWEKDKTGVDNEAGRGFTGRFGAGLPRISDAQFLFMQHVIAKLKTKEEGGGDAAVVFNGSPLFTGDAGGGESEIRRWILEKDLLDTIVALPEKLFFNTGISTYIWIFSTKKSADRKDKVSLIDARNIHTQLRKNLGEKRYEISDDNAKEVLAYYSNNKDSDNLKIFNTTDFAYRQIAIQRPLRLRFDIADESMARLKEHKEFLNDVPSKKAGAKGEAENKAWQELRTAIYEILESTRGKTLTSRAKFIEKLESELKKRDLKITKKTLKTVWQQIGERDEEAEICLDEDGNKEADNDLKDFERVPWGMDIKEYFKKEVLPYASDAWIDESVCDEKDGKVGIVGYEIPFTRFFFRYEEPRKVDEVEKDIKSTETDVQKLLKELGI